MKSKQFPAYLFIAGLALIIVGAAIAWPVILAGVAAVVAGGVLGWRQPGSGAEDADRPAEGGFATDAYEAGREMDRRNRASEWSRSSSESGSSQASAGSDSTGTSSSDSSGGDNSSSGSTS
jgi:hypothetical protein